MRPTPVSAAWFLGCQRSEQSRRRKLSGVVSIRTPQLAWIAAGTRSAVPRARDIEHRPYGRGCRRPPAGYDSRASHNPKPYDPQSMDDLVLQAAQAILPFLGAGVGAAAHGFAEQIGANISDKTLSIVEQVQQRLEKSDPSQPAVAKVLRCALREREIVELDLRTLIAECSPLHARLLITGSQAAGRDIHNSSTIGEINNW